MAIDHDPGSAIFDGSVADVLDTQGDYGRALCAATVMPIAGQGVDAVLLWAEGGVWNDAIEQNTNNCEDIMGVPEGPGLWVWEGTVRLISSPGDSEVDVCYVGTWRLASLVELSMFQTGRNPFEKADVV